MSEILGLETEPKTVLYAPEVVNQKGVEKACYFDRPITLLPDHKILCAPNSILEASVVPHAKTSRVLCDNLLLDINRLKIEKVRAIATLLSPYNQLVDRFFQDKEALSTQEVITVIEKIEKTTQQNPDHSYDFRNAALFRLLIVSPKQSKGEIYKALQESKYSRFNLKQISSRQKSLEKVFILRAQMGHQVKPSSSKISGAKQETDYFSVWQHPQGNIESLKELIQARLLRKSAFCAQQALLCGEEALGEYAHEFAAMAIDAGGINNKALAAKGVGILLGGVPEYLMSLEQLASQEENFGSSQRFEQALISFAQRIKKENIFQKARDLLGHRKKIRIAPCASRQSLAMTAPTF